MSTPGTLTHALQALIADWRQRAIAVAVQGNCLTVRPIKGPLPPDVDDLAHRLEPEIIAVLRGQRPDMSWREQLRSWPVDRMEEFEERAAIREFDAGMPRPLAELAAYRDMLDWEGRQSPGRG